MPDRYLACPAKGCSHTETIPPNVEPYGEDDPTYSDLWDHVATAHAEGSVGHTSLLMADVKMIVPAASPGDTRPGDCPICGPVTGCRCPKTLGDADVSIMQDGEWVHLPGVRNVEINEEPDPELDKPWNPRPRSFLAQRLIDRHGIDPAAAEHATACLARGEDAPHADLVRAEVHDLLTEMATSLNQAMRDLAEVLIPAFQALGETAKRAASRTQDDFQLMQGAGQARERPAWQSTYGPPQKGHRR